MKTNSIAAIALLSLLLVASCTKEEFTEPKVTNALSNQNLEVGDYFIYRNHRMVPVRSLGTPVKRSDVADADFATPPWNCDCPRNSPRFADTDIDRLTTE